MSAPTDLKTIDAIRLDAARRMRPRKPRTFLEFAEQEIYLPSGPRRGQRFSAEYQPFTRLWLTELENPAYNEFTAVGPVQSGKSFIAFILPIVYWLFEANENVIVGVPRDKDKVDKWADIRKVIDRTAYAELYPERGPGSQGGQFNTIEFKNGAMLKFMTGGGGDEERSAFPARIVVMTEVDKFDERSDASKETDPISQIKNRTKAFWHQRRIYMECTASVPKGAIWHARKQGTEDEIAVACLECGKWFTPGREHLKGWQDAKNEYEAEAGAYFECDKCGHRIDERERLYMNRNAVVVSAGQRIERDKIKGKPKQTRIKSFRWSAFNNQFLTIGHIAAEEYKAAAARNADDAERELLQFTWALPWEDTEGALDTVEVDDIMRRQADFGRGIVPPGFDRIALGVDVGKWWIHYTALAVKTETAALHVIDYDAISVPAQTMSTEQAVTTALYELRERIDGGYATDDGRPAYADLVLVDAGWQAARTDADFVYNFCTASGNQYMPLKGFGSGQFAGTNYRTPKQLSQAVAKIGQHYHTARIIKPGTPPLLLLEIDTDHWKSYLHNRLTCPIDDPAALTLYKTAPSNHRQYANHLTVEQQIREHDPKRGTVVRWLHERGPNHWFDASCYAAVAAHKLGARLAHERAAEAVKQIAPGDWYE